MNTKPWSDFEPTASDEWLAVARQELQGKDPFENLAIAKEKIKILPYYDKRSWPSENFFSVPASGVSFGGSRAWQNMPKIVVAREKEANQQALEHLNRGADGILFELRGQLIKLEELLKDIQLPHCSTAFSGNWPASFQDDFISFAKQQFGTHGIPGFFTNGSRDQIPFFPSQTLSLFRPFGLRVKENAPADESIAEAIGQLVSLVDRFTDEGHTATAIFQQVSFDVSVGTDFFLDVARLKTIRSLSRLVAHAYGVTPDEAVYIHATSNAWAKQVLQPHENLLKSTTAGLAAVLGGCDSLTIEPEDAENELMGRLARNLSLLFREEAHLTRVSDPLAGSYYIDSLTNELTAKSWEAFLSINR